MPRYIDIHSHVHFPEYDEDRAEVLARMRKSGVWTIAVGTDLEHSKQSVDFAEKHDGIFATVGLHPNSSNEESFDENSFEELLESKKVVAIGECGLDYFRSDISDAKVKQNQHEQFQKQIEFAVEHELPLVLHLRPSKGSMDAYNDALAILRHFPKARGDVHFFVGDTAVAEGFLELGFSMSFTGVLTFARDYDEVVRMLPLRSIMSETDAPFAAPKPYRGKRNEPAYVIEVIRAIAEIRGEDEELVRAAVLENALELFAISG